MKKTFFITPWLGGCLLLSLGIWSDLHAASAEAEAPVAYVELLSKPPKLDGHATDWPKGSLRQITSPDGTAAFRLGYDAEHFYAWVQVRDASPFKNAAGRVQELMKGGDAVGFYFGGPAGTEQRVLFANHEGQPVVYVYRPHSEVKEPYVFASPTGESKFDYVAPLTDAKWAMAATQNGYLLEVAIPWKSLGLKPEKTFPFDLQVIFSDPAGTTNVGSVWWFSNGGPGRTTEDLPTEAQLYPDTWGEAQLVKQTPKMMPAEATSAAKVIQPAAQIALNLPRAGRVSLIVLDEKGWIVRELLRAEKREAGPLVVFWDGRDRYEEPLPVGNYRWKAIVFDGLGSRFMGSVGDSGRPPYRTPDGLGAMGGQHGVEKAVAADAGGIYMAGGLEEGQPAMRKIDAKTGVALWKRSAGAFGVIKELATDDAAGTACMINMARRKNAGPSVDLVLIDPLTGKDVGKEARIPLDADKDTRFGGLAMVGGRAFFTLPEKNQVVAVDIGTKQVLEPMALEAPQGICRFDAEHLLICTGKRVVKVNIANGKTEVVLDGLQAPRSVAVDRQGNLYVSDLGNSQQIKKFTPEGELLATWGREGGKSISQNPYDPLAFKNVTGLAVGPDGNLWVAEASSPPRRFVKMTTDGKWLEDFYGPVAYNTFGPDLDDVETVYFSSNAGGDPNFIQTHVDYAKYQANPMDPAAAWQVEAIFDFSRGADGVTVNELMGKVAGNGYGHVVAFSGTNGKKYFFRTSKGNRASQPAGAGIWIWEKDRWVPSAFLSRNDKENPSWTDQNGDGLIQENETFTGFPVTSVIWMNRDLVLDGFEGTVKPASVDDRGVPQYDKGTFTAYLSKDEPSYQEGWTFASPQVEGAVYYVANPGPERHLTFWDRANENRLIKVADGKVQWVIGEHSERANFAEFSTVSGIAGVVDDILLAHNVEPANYIGFTSDGLTLGNAIADENGVRPSVGPISINIENFTGLFIKDSKSGRRMLFSVSSGDDRILEITGPGELTRLNGEVALPAVLPLQAGEGDEVEIPYQIWRGANNRTKNLDAVDAEWPAVKTGVPLIRDGSVIGDVRLRRDNGQLCVMANVLDAAAMKPGDGIEVTLAAADGSKASTFLITPNANPKSKSPGTVWLDGAEIPKSAAGIQPRWNGLGWRLEADLPLDLIPLAVSRRQPVRVAARDGRTGKMSDVKNEEAEVADLSGPLSLSVAWVSKSGGTSERVSWPAKGLGKATAP